jgi:hypothetical protein
MRRGRFNPIPETFNTSSVNCYDQKSIPEIAFCIDSIQK